MARNFADLIKAYIDYASFTEAPKKMHFWSIVSAIAGALRRKVWFEQQYFRWYPNHYIIFVAPPGVVSKSTTANVSMSLLRQVPGIKFGPDVTTWPALVTAFSESMESFQFGDEWVTQCALTLESSELGNLLNPEDREMVDLLVNLWDAKTGAFRKTTKTSGMDNIENPWINIIACTTPAWIAGSFPEYIIGGGFTSRTIFVYAEKKERLIPYPGKHTPAGLAETRTKLIQDLEHISQNLVGRYILTPEAEAWGEEWYVELNTNPPEALRDDRFGGYLARKQTHLHKLAMVLAASQRDELVIEKEDLIVASEMLSDIEADMPKVFSKIGRTDQSIQAEKLLNYVRAKREIPLALAYQQVHSAFPDGRQFAAVIQGMIAARLVVQTPPDKDGIVYLKAI